MAISEGNPLVSVVMPVFNGELYLHEAIDSVLAQVDVPLELIIINDGSGDETVNIIDSYADPRIRLIHNNQSEGVSTCLNKGIELARSQYVARMDCDDICLPGRFKKQLDMLYSHPNIGICGTKVEFIGNWHGKDRMNFWEAEDLRAYILFANPFPHPTVMMNRNLLDKHRLRYNPLLTAAQDYDLWERASQCFDFLKIPEVFLKYRMHGENITSQRKNTAEKVVHTVYKRMFNRCGLELTEEEITLHHLIARKSRRTTLSDLIKVESWLFAMQEKLMRAGSYKKESLNSVLGYFWFEVSRNCGNLGLGAVNLYNKSRLRKYFKPHKKDLMIFFVSAIKHQFSTS